MGMYDERPETTLGQILLDLADYSVDYEGDLYWLMEGKSGVLRAETEKIREKIKKLLIYHVNTLLKNERGRNTPQARDHNRTLKAVVELIGGMK